MGGTVLQELESCSVKKTARKSTQYLRNETILKIDYLADVIANAKAIALQIGYCPG